MFIIDYLTGLANTPLFLLLGFIAISFSILAVTLIRRILPVSMLYKDDAVIGYISALIGIIYGVLAGLMALYLINNINYTADAVQNETNAVANIYRNSKWLKNPVQVNIQNAIKSYIHEVVEIEWPWMEAGKTVDNKGNTMIDAIADQLRTYKVTTQRELLIMRDLLEEVKALYNARQQRIHMSYSVLNVEIWVVIMVGTILTMAINYLFGMNFKLHIVTVSAAALMCSSMIFLLITLDRPFQGEFIIEPDGFYTVLSLIEQG